MNLKINSFCVKEPADTKTTRPHQLPIYATSSFEFSNIEEGVDIFKDPSSGHVYGRFGNPTVDAVANKIAGLESHGTGIQDAFGIMTSSGMSAISTLIMALLRKGDKILTQGNLYGGTTELIKSIFTRYGIDPIFVRLSDGEAVRRAIDMNPDIRLIYFETPSNPSLDCIDIRQIAEMAKKKGLITIVDNTFSTPLLQQPFRFGVDYIVHSTTKYLNGHGNCIAGVIIGRGEENRKKVWSVMKLIGTNCNPFDAWLTNNGLKTLAVRMERHCHNGQVLAEFLESHPQVAGVRYLGLSSHPDHLVAKEIMSGFGGMLSFEVRGGYEAGCRFMNEQKMGTLAPTLGDVDTLILHPASMSHLNVPPAIRAENGITDGLIRVSTGIEDIRDIVDDFDRALNTL